MNVILDGKVVEPSVINPQLHKCIGTYRPPANQLFKGSGYIQCSCGTVLTFLEQNMEHYQAGHFDVPQYVTIKKCEQQEAENYKAELKAAHQMIRIIVETLGGTLRIPGDRIIALDVDKSVLIQQVDKSTGDMILMTR